MATAVGTADAKALDFVFVEGFGKNVDFFFYFWFVFLADDGKIFWWLAEEVFAPSEIGDSGKSGVGEVIETGEFIDAEMKSVAVYQTTLKHGSDFGWGREKTGFFLEGIAVGLAEIAESIKNTVEKERGRAGAARDDGDVEVDGEGFGVDFGFDERAGDA